MNQLDLSFFEQNTLTVAQALLGRYLVRDLGPTRLVCRITETEAYVGRVDKACHAYNYKQTPRTQTLFAAPGTIYIYLIYGMYHCLNFVTEPAGEPCAVLLRGAQPVLGIDEMAQARFGRDAADMTAYQRKNFLNGPGKLCTALSLTRAENNTRLDGPLWIAADPAELGLTPTPIGTIHTGPRINISYAEEAIDFPWRFWIDPI